MPITEHLRAALADRFAVAPFVFPSAPFVIPSAARDLHFAVI
jgi:hypothetical protein